MFDLFLEIDSRKIIKIYLEVIFRATGHCQTSSTRIKHVNAAVPEIHTSTFVGRSFKKCKIAVTREY